MKYCPKCMKSKRAGEFYKRKDSRDGLTVSCKSCNTEAKRNKYRNKTQIERVPCEVCWVPTTAKDGMCSRCSREALLEFGSMIHNYSANTKPKADQLKYYEDAYKSAYSVEARLRFKRIVAAMRKVMYGEEEATERGRTNQEVASRERMACGRGGANDSTNLDKEGSLRVHRHDCCARGPDLGGSGNFSREHAGARQEVASTGSLSLVRSCG